MTQKKNSNEQQLQDIEDQEQVAQVQISSVQDVAKKEDNQIKVLRYIIQTQLQQEKQKILKKIQEQQTKNTYIASLMKKTFAKDQQCQDLQLFIDEYQSKALNNYLDKPKISSQIQVVQNKNSQKFQNDKKLEQQIQKIQINNEKKHKQIFKLKIKHSQSKLRKIMNTQASQSVSRIKQYKQNQRDKIKGIIEHINKQSEEKNQLYQEIVNRTLKPQQKQQKEIHQKLIDEKNKQKKKGKSAYKEQKRKNFIPKFVEMQIEYQQKQKQDILDNNQSVKQQKQIDFQEINKFEKDYLRQTLDKSQFKKTFIKQCDGDVQFSKLKPSPEIAKMKVAEQQKMQILKCKSQIIRKKLHQKIYGNIVSKVYKPEYTQRQKQEFAAQQRKLNWKKIQDQQLQEQKQKNLEEIPNYLHSIEDARNQYYSQDFMKPRYTLLQKSVLRETASQDLLQQKLQIKKAELKLSNDLKASYFFMYKANKSQFSCNKPKISIIQKEKLQKALQKKKLRKKVVFKDKENLLKSIKENENDIQTQANHYYIQNHRAKMDFSPYLSLAKQKLELLKNIL